MYRIKRDVRRASVARRDRGDDQRLCRRLLLYQLELAEDGCVVGAKLQAVGRWRMIVLAGAARHCHAVRARGFGLRRARRACIRDSNEERKQPRPENQGSEQFAVPAQIHRVTRFDVYQCRHPPPGVVDARQQPAISRRSSEPSLEEARRVVAGRVCFATRPFPRPRSTCRRARGCSSSNVG